MIVLNATRNTVLSDQCRFANSFWKRMVGLLNRREVDKGEGLLLDRCYGIHTFGMKFPIDIVCLDKNFVVLRTIAQLPPFRACILNQAAFIVELPAGTLDRTQTIAGDQIHISANKSNGGTADVV